MPLEINGTQALVDLEDGKADLAIRYQRRPPTRFSTKELFRDTFRPVFVDEGQAIEAAVAGQGIAILGDVYIANELARGSLVKAFDFSLPGFGYYLTYLPDHPRLTIIWNLYPGFDRSSELRTTEPPIEYPHYWPTARCHCSVRNRLAERPQSPHRGP
jgi:DNA-binding transcriptional LysR family regulator